MILFSTRTRFRRFHRMDGSSSSAQLHPTGSDFCGFVAFFVDGKLKKIDVNAGGPITLCDAPNSYVGAWSGEDVIVFTPNFTSGLVRVSAAGGVPTPITEL